MTRRRRDEGIGEEMDESAESEKLPVNPNEEEPIDKYLDEVQEQVAEDFEERQNLSEEGRRKMAERLEQHNQLSPEISAGDIDAKWEGARQSGEESFTGHVPTPDQDVIDELGEAAGLTYEDDELLNYGKVSERDEKRWELDPRSAVEEQRVEELEDEEELEDYEEEEGEDEDELHFWDQADDLDDEVDEDDLT